MTIEVDNRIVQKAARAVFGWIDDLRAEYPSVDPEEVAQVYGHQLSANETGIDRSCVEDVFIGLALGVYELGGSNEIRRL